MLQIAAITIAVLLAAILFVLVYRSARSYNAGAHATFVTTKGGDFYGALRSPTTLWDPTVKVLREKNAPDITFVTQDASGTDFHERSLVVRRTGEISLRVNICSPRPFVARTSDKRQLRVRARVAFQLDVDRIQIPCQMQSFGATLGGRIENLFDNAIGAHEDQEVFAKQSEIEASVLRQLQDTEFPPDPSHPTGMPLGIKVYEAVFSYEPVTSTAGVGDGMRGAMAYARDDLDDLADMLEKADPKTVEMVLRMMEMQTRQNIVEILCKSGGLVAFTAQELGLSEPVVERARSGAHLMKPQQAAGPGANGSPAAPAQPAAPVDPAAAYYGLGAPTRRS